MSRIAAVTLDAGGTLVAPWPSVGAVYADTLRRDGVPGLSESDLEAGFHAAWATRGGFNYSRDSWARLVGRVLEGRVPADRFEPAFERLWHRFTEPDAWRVFPDVLPCLRSLRRRGVRLAVVSNWDERLHRVLDALGLSDAFEWVLPSIECPAPKPDIRIFQTAAARLGLQPDTILHVGDSRSEDFLGATQAGFQARWLCRDGRAEGEPGCIASLGDLDAVIAAAECAVVPNGAPPGR